MAKSSGLKPSNILIVLLLVAAAGLGLWAMLEPTPHLAASNPVPDGEAFAGDYVLAVSWQPAFCETRPDKPECRSQTETRFDAAHFTLHGLWPEPRSNVYCGVANGLEQDDRRGRWGSVDALQLSAATANELSKVMPGTQSMLERHEWIKHGTCTGANAEDYYKLSLKLVSTLNATPIRDLFVQNRGKLLTAERVRAAFDRAFGKGSGQRVLIDCNNDGDRRLIGGLQIALRDPVAGDFQQAINAAKPSSPGCSSGEIDRVGIQ